MATEPVKIPGDPPPVILNQDPVADAAAAAAAAVVADAATSPVDEFAAMFANFAKDEPLPVTPATATEPAKIEPKVETPTAATTEPVKTPEELAAEAAKTTTPTEAPKPPQPDPIERLADLLGERLPQPQQQRQQAPEVAPVYSQEEAAALRAFYADWPEIAQAQELALRATAQQITNHVFTEVARVMGPKMKLLEALADNAQYDSIEKKVPDYATVTDKVAEWVDKQPAYLKNAYTGVMQSGTADEIADLIGRFREATGTAAPTQQGQTQQVTSVVTPPALSPAAKQAAARLAPVSGKKAGVVPGAPQTFEDGFDHFAKMLTG